MKRLLKFYQLFVLVLGLPFFVQTTTAQPQMEFWSLPPSLISFPGSTSTTLPATNDYLGQHALNVSNCMYDLNGNLLFFIVDYEVFDANGFLIDNLHINSTPITPGSEMCIVPVPGSCSKFYIIGSYLNTLGNAWIPFYTTIDMDLPSLIYPGLFLLGQLQYFGGTSSIFDLSTISPFEAYDDPGLPNSERNRFGLAVSPFRPTTNDHFLFMKGFTSPDNLYRYIIDANGITFDSGGGGGDGGILTVTPSLPSALDNDAYPEMELVDLKNGIYRIAWVSGFHTIFVSELDYYDGSFIVNSARTAVLPFTPNFADQITGLEFSPNGILLYYSYYKEDAGGVLVSQHIGNVWMIPAVLTTFEMIDVNFPGANTLGYSFIEMGYDGKLHYADGQQLQLLSLTSPNGGPSIWGPTITHSSSSNLLPDQIDGEYYFSGATSSSTRRRDIDDFTATQKAQLSNLIVQFIQDNAFTSTDLGNGLGGFTGTEHHDYFAQHGNCNFLPWHRGFIEQLEAYLLKKPGGESYVPLPKWLPTKPIPSQFYVVGQINDDTPIDGPHAYDFTNLENDPCANSFCAFSNLVEQQHNKVHLNIGGDMGSTTTAAGVAIFYLWHAYLDDLYWNYESSCTPCVNPDHDLFIRDNGKEIATYWTFSDDLGIEPNTNTDVWKSPDIWVRNTKDGPAPGTLPGQGYFTQGYVDAGVRHQDPEYTPNMPVWVYIKVRNRGTHTVSGAEFHLYFTKASPGEKWPDVWVNNGVNGDEITPSAGIPLPALVPGQIYTVEYPWQPPFVSTPTMYCLLARVISPNDPMTYEQGVTGNSHDVFDNVVNNNNIATKNLDVVNILPNLVNFSGTFSMSASDAGLAVIDFIPVPVSESGISYTDVGTVTVALGDFYANWEAAMFAASPFIEDVGGGNIQLLSGGDMDDYWINAMLEPNDSSTISLSFDLDSNFAADYGHQDWLFEFAHEIHDISGTGQPPGIFLVAENYNIVVDFPCDANAGPDTLITNDSCVIIGTTSTCLSCDFQWQEDGNIIPGATGQTVEVCPTYTSSYTLTVSDTSSGCHFTDTAIVYVDRICSAELGLSEYSIEHGQCVQIGGSGSNCPNCTFSWSPTTGLSNPNIPNPIACPTDDIVYTLTVSEDSFCFAQSTVMVHVYHCDVMVDAGPNQLVINLGDGVIIGTPDSMLTYNWFPQESLDDPTAAQPYAQPTETTTYIVYAHHIDHDCFLAATDTVTVTVCTSIYYEDADGDAYGNADSSIFACSPPAGYVGDNTDCDDLNPSSYPGAAELCNNLDDDCDGQTDEGLSEGFQFNYSFTCVNAGSTVNITWTGGCPSWNVDISLGLVSSNSGVLAIATNLPNTGSYSWAVPTSLPADTYFLYVPGGSSSGNGIPFYIGSAAGTEFCNGIDDDCSGSAESPTNTWTGLGDNLNWSLSTNWSNGIVPLTCQHVVIPAGKTVLVAAGVQAVGMTLEVPVSAVLTVEGTGVLTIQN